MPSMRRRVVILYCIGLAAIMVPILAAILLAAYMSVDRQRDRASAMAADILHRSHKVSDQLAHVFAELSTRQTPEPCAEPNLNLMRKLVIQSNLLLDVGYVADEQLVCSSFGSIGYRLGPKSYVSAAGYNIWTQFEHPLLPGSRLVVTGDAKTGFAALVHERTVLDGAALDKKLTYGVLGVGRRKEIFHNGLFDPLWFDKIGDKYETSFFDGAGVVAWKRSDRYDYAAYVAIPRSEIEHDGWRVLLVLLPIGIGAAGVLAFVVAQLVRINGALPAALRVALKRGEFFLVYQPIVDLRTKEWVGAEALLRWRKSTGEFVSPDVFIPVAERNRLIERITQRVLELVASDAADLLRKRPDFHVAVNLSAQDICNPDICARLRAITTAMGINNQCIHIEATERVFLHAEQARKSVEALRAQGHLVAIDDFGTGYSSLSYLTEFTMDSLKIDKCFVGTIGQHAVTSHVIGHIIEMAKSLELKMIAEGIETEEQAEYLRAHGVQFGQGWLFSKPMPMHELVEQLASRRSPERPVGS